MGGRMRLMDSITGAVAELPTGSRKALTWYTCGPTVYDEAHLGHGRAYVTVDLMQRVLERRFGRAVVHAMGMTDVDDKILQRASAAEAGAGPPYLRVARAFEARFWADMDALRVRRPAHVLRVSEHVPDVVTFVEALEAAGFAYRADDGVYFDAARFSGRFKMHPAGPSGVDANARPATADRESKRAPQDFVLWKAADARDAALGTAWPAPFGAGRPGWHIECSAMASGVFGDSVDVHAGGVDLRFPHHCNELAQSEARWGCDAWVRHFVHVGHLHIEGRKMSKSLKNFITIRDFLGAHDANSFRLLCMRHHYRAPMDYSVEEMAMHVARLDAGFSGARAAALAAARAESAAPMASVQRWDSPEHALHAGFVDFEDALDARLADDFDTPAAIQMLADRAADLQHYVARRASGRARASSARSGTASARISATWALCTAAAEAMASMAPRESAALRMRW
jgi:cysteinyl-tRNA synthetase